MKILICDDDVLFGQTLEKHLERYEITENKDFTIRVVNSGEEAWKNLTTESWDVLFLDIEMPLVDGVTIGVRVREQLKNYSLKIVYVSSNSSYAMDLFKINTFDFLIKPVEYHDVSGVLDKLFQCMDRSGEMYVYQKKGQRVRCRIEDILYFESDLKKTIIVTNDRKDEFYSSLSTVYNDLKDKDFFFCHRSILVNYNRVLEFYYDRLVLDNKEVLEISQAKRKEVRKMICERGMK